MMAVVTKKNMFWIYRYSDYYLWNQCGNLSYEEVLFFGRCLREKRKLTSFTERELEFWNAINGKFAHTDELGNIIPDILVFTPAHLEKIHQMLQKHKNFSLLLRHFQDAHKKLYEILSRYNHNVLRGHIGYNICMELYSIRMMSVHDLVEKDFLKLPADPDKSSLGIHIILC